MLSKLSPAQIKAAQEAYGKEMKVQELPKNVEVPETLKQSNPAPSKDVNLLNNAKYGYSFFTATPSATLAVGDLPLPSEYKISLKDELTIIMSGSKDAIFDLSVKLDGTILFPELGPISVVGKTLEEIRNSLTNLINQSYIGVEISVSINQLSAKKITIVGAVKTPGTYLINPFSTITSALAYSGGISEIGTLRNIKLIRNNGDIYLFDLYDLLINGDRSRDITIEAGDTILIDAADQFIKINGAVKRPAIYELLESETLQDAINFALGFETIANKNNISVSYLDLEDTSISKITTDNLNISIRDAVAIDVFSYINEEISSIQVLGAIEEPGFYSLEENKQLNTLINNLDFTEVYPWVAVLEKFDKDNIIKSSILFNLNDPSTIKSIDLIPNSKVIFFKLNKDGTGDIDLSEANQLSIDLINDYSLKINYKNKDYIHPVIGLFELNEIIDYLGLDMTDVEDDAFYISPLDNIVEQKNYKNMIYSAKKYNTINFRSPINDLITVNIEGALFFPGTYTLNATATLEDLYNIVGSFKDNAFFDGIIFKTESQKKSQIIAIESAKKSLQESLLISAIDAPNEVNPEILLALNTDIDTDNLGRVSGVFSPGSFESSNIVLSDGDSIFIPKSPNFVSVMGEVLNPISITHEKGMTVEDVISLAGGYRDLADKKKVYIIRANGLSEKRSRNIFLKTQELSPGDTVVIPRKIFTTSPIIKSLTPITQILSDLSFSAAAIDNLKSN